MKEFAVIAHRGASEKKTENTLGAFTKALEEGATGLEIDLRRTRDGHIVALHDETVDRTTDGQGLLSVHSLDQVENLNLKDGEKIPTLQEVTAFLQAHELEWILLELKEDGLEAEVVEAMVANGLGENAYVFNSL